MQPHLDREIPVVVISNITEAFFEFPSRAEDATERERLIHHAQCQGERSLLWLGDPKLVFVTFPVPHTGYLHQRLGYRGTGFAAPAEPSPFLSLDILREPALVTRLLEYAGEQRTVQLIPYATTRQFLQLVETLRTDYKLNILLPESPTPECLWLRDYIDTKAGFRALASRWLPNSAKLLPEGIVCQDAQQAAAVAYWFGHNGRPCIIKPDNGMGGLGHQILHPGDFSSPEDILHQLQANPFLHDDLIAVEEFIHSPTSLSPSLELFVPPLGAGRPEITYLCNQLFMGLGNSFLLSRELLDTKWYPVLAESGLLIATRLQEMGYVGHFDIDTIVDDEERVFLLEVNSRRTAGTHIHEFARFLFGPDYLDDIVLLGHGAMESGSITRPDELLELIDDLLYPIQQEQRGVVVTVTSTLSIGDFGCIIVAPSTEEALTLQQTLMERIRNAGG